MGTPGRAKALRALGAAKRKNRQRIAEGKRPVIGGKQVSHSTFKKVTGTSVKDVKKGGPPGKSEAKSKSEIKKKWGSKAVEGHGMQMGTGGFGITHGYEDGDETYDNEHEYK